MLIAPGSIFYDFVVLLATLLAGVIISYKWLFSYWKRKGVEFIQPTIPFGNFGPLLRQQKDYGELFEDYYKELKSRGVKFGGSYAIIRPIFIPVNLQLVKNILSKDFAHFVNHGMYCNEEGDPLSAHLFSLEDEKWKNLRTKLTPTFTASKIKMMFHTLLACSEGVVNFIEDAGKNKESIDIKDIISRFTIDVIASCAFGVESNSIKDPDTPFRIYGKRWVENTAIEAIKLLASFMVPKTWLKKVGFKITKSDVENFYINVVTETVKNREENKIRRNDFMHLLLQLRKTGEIGDDNVTLATDKSSTELSMSVTDIAAQVFLFFIAGFETSSTTGTYAILELCNNPDIQHRVRQEIHEVLGRHGGKCTYEACNELKYMEQVINETLRMYPPLPNLTRICTKDYLIPDTTITVEKDTMVMIPVTGIHHDPDYYPEPQKFDPERFSEDNKHKIPPFAWIPFGEGPRVCIGIRLGVLQTKIALVAILKNHCVALNKAKTEPKPLKDKTTFITSVHGGVWVHVKAV